VVKIATFAKPQNVIGNSFGATLKKEFDNFFYYDHTTRPLRLTSTL
jgi:hypothetical protein